MKTSLQWKNPRQAAMDPEAVLAELAQELSQQASDEVDEYIKQWHESGLKAFQKTSGAGATSVGERKKCSKNARKRRKWAQSPNVATGESFHTHPGLGSCGIRQSLLRRDLI